MSARTRTALYDVAAFFGVIGLIGFGALMLFGLAVAGYR